MAILRQTKLDPASRTIHLYQKITHIPDQPAGRCLSHSRGEGAHGKAGASLPQLLDKENWPQATQRLPCLPTEGSLQARAQGTGAAVTKSWWP